ASFEQLAGGWIPGGKIGVPTIVYNSKPDKGWTHPNHYRSVDWVAIDRIGFPCPTRKGADEVFIEDAEDTVDGWYLVSDLWDYTEPTLHFRLERVVELENAVEVRLTGEVHTYNPLGFYLPMK